MIMATSIIVERIHDAKIVVISINRISYRFHYPLTPICSSDNHNGSWIISLDNRQDFFGISLYFFPGYKTRLIAYIINHMHITFFFCISRDLVKELCRFFDVIHWITRVAHMFDDMPINNSIKSKFGTDVDI